MKAQRIAVWVTSLLVLALIVAVVAEVLVPTFDYLTTALDGEGCSKSPQLYC